MSVWMFFTNTADAAIASILFLSGLTKIWDLKGFIGIVHGFDILPSRAVPLFATALTVVEVLVAVALFSRVLVDSSFNAWAGLIAACLFAMFGLALAVNLIRGRTEISCGCFGNTHRKISWGLVVRAVMCSAVSGVTLPILQEGTLAGTTTGDRLNAALVGIAIVAAVWLCRFILKPLSISLERQS